MAKTKLAEVPVDEPTNEVERRAPVSVPPVATDREWVKKWVRRELALAAGGVNEAHREEMNP